MLILWDFGERIFYLEFLGLLHMLVSTRNVKSSWYLCETTRSIWPCGHTWLDVWVWFQSLIVEIKDHNDHNFIQTQILMKCMKVPTVNFLFEPNFIPSQSQGFDEQKYIVCVIIKCILLFKHLKIILNVNMLNFISLFLLYW